MGNVPIMIVANKMDLEDKREVSTFGILYNNYINNILNFQIAGREYAAQRNLLYIETRLVSFFNVILTHKYLCCNSAKTAANLQYLFPDLAKRVMAYSAQQGYQ